ncbi:MAG: murein L,D-transpeptidase catalytic domain family protein [Acidobacteriota bacterium]|nr:murein L,D-transpeptidase catalytic domain family protein [Acidobacteriota bacterium]
MKRLLLTIAVALAFAVPMRAAESSDALVASLVTQAPGLSADVLKLALAAASRAEDRGLVTRRNLLTVIDYSLPSSQPRLFIFDLAAHRLLFRELVAHGKGSGGDLASFFSNDPGSLATSLGLFVTADTYNGGNGYSLRLRGLEEGINDMAWDRAIVLHGASYVSQEAVKGLGRLGRSWGCPAVRREVSQKIIDTIRGGSPVFAYYPDKSWLSTSAFLRQVAGAIANTTR